MARLSGVHWSLLSAAGDPDTNVTINRQRAIEALRHGFSFVSPALLDLMMVQIKALEASRAKSSHMLVPVVCWWGLGLSLSEADGFRHQLSRNAFEDTLRPMCRRVDRRLVRVVAQAYWSGRLFVIGAGVLGRGAAALAAPHPNRVRQILDSRVRFCHAKRPTSRVRVPCCP